MDKVLLEIILLQDDVSPKKKVSNYKIQYNLDYRKLDYQNLDYPNSRLIFHIGILNQGNTLSAIKVQRKPLIHA